MKRLIWLTVFMAAPSLSQVLTLPQDMGLPESSYERPDPETIRSFQTLLMNAGFATMLRATRGGDINAACGQLVGRVQDRTKRQQRYLARVRAQEVA